MPGSLRLVDDAQPAAAVVRRSDAVTEEQIYQYLKPLLSRYKLPSAVYFVTELPHSNGGKVLRQKVIEVIKEMSRHTAELDSATVNHILEGKIIAAWTEVLGIQTLARTDHFIASGGDSLSAVSLTIRITDACGVTFSLEDVFNYPTPALQAEEIQRRLTSALPPS